MLESLDWHWVDYGGDREHPVMLLPSEYFRRPILGSFWFERETVNRVIDLMPDNVMFECDFPHPTSLSPGPLSTAEQPAAMARDTLEGVPDDIARKVLYENAAAFYHL